MGGYQTPYLVNSLVVALTYPIVAY